MPGFAQLSRRTPSREAGVDEPEELLHLLVLVPAVGFDGGAVPIVAQEVVALAGMEELGCTCRDSTVTLSDMA